MNFAIFLFFLVEKEGNFANLICEKMTSTFLEFN